MTKGTRGFESVQICADFFQREFLLTYSCHSSPLDCRIGHMIGTSGYGLTVVTSSRGSEMKIRHTFSFSVAFLGISIMLMTGCATVRAPEVQPVPGEKVQVSKTVAAEKQGGKYLKRKVAIARFSNETVYGQGFCG